MKHIDLYELFTFINIEATQIKVLNSGEIVVKCHSVKNLQTLMQYTCNGQKQITVRQPKNLIQTQGVLKKSAESISEVKYHFHSVIDLKRLKNRHRQDSQAVLITFKDNALLKSALIGFIEYKVEKFMTPPSDASMLGLQSLCK